MTASITCKCNFSEDQRWHLQWATLGPRQQLDKQVAFSIRPQQFVFLIQYVQGAIADPPQAVTRPDLDAVGFRVRYRRNAKRFEVRIRTESGGLNAMIDGPQMTSILQYLQQCLQGYAIAVYEGRTPIPEGYPEGYPEPHWG